MNNISLKAETFLEKTYGEALALITQTQRYGARMKENHVHKKITDHHLALSGEFSHVAAKLAHALSWILGQKAVAAGEISAAEASRRFRLHDALRNRSVTQTDYIMPPELTQLIKESDNLFARVKRLSNRIDTSTQTETLH